MHHPDLQVPVTALLKQQTAAPHADLEAIVRPHLETMAAPEDYASLLIAFHGFFAPLERAIGPWITAQTLPDWPERRKAALLRADLAILLPGSGPLPHTTDLPAISSEAAALGALYVMEGSTLGGRSITRMIRQALPALSPDALRFFTGYGADTGTRWVAFQEALTDFADTEEKQAQLIAAACETFQKFGTWMEQTL
jgi:heme oxygenase